MRVEIVATCGSAAASLKTLAQRVDASKCGEPASLVVIVASGYAYRREDGVVVCPVVSLGP